MFWQLLLAHFIADYPLQPNWMVRAKRRPAVLGLHVTVHFLVSALLVFPYFFSVWWGLLVLAIVHYVIDYLRLRYKPHRPGAGSAAYVVDQLLHYASILMIVGWLRAAAGPFQPLFPASLAIITTGYVLVTYVWLITERILVADGMQFGLPLKAQPWPRLAARAVMLSLFLVVFQPDLLAFNLSAVTFLPYLTLGQPWKAVLIDVLIVVLVGLFIHTAVNFGLPAG